MRLKYSPAEAIGAVSILCAATAHASTTTSSASASQFTIPAADYEASPVLPTIQDPKAVDPQAVCPGYVATHVRQSRHGLTASLVLAGDACNAYGTDIQSLNLTVEYQTTNRLHVGIAPTYLGASNMTQYLIPPSLLARPGMEPGNGTTDLKFSWSNTPSFGFNVTRRSTGDVLFSTTGKKLVFENQFVEFSSSLPENYNLYGLGESMRSFRQGNNYTQTFYNADIGDALDSNLYGTHPFYLESRYFTTDKTGKRSPVTTTQENSPHANYTVLSHGVYQRSAHGQDVLLRPDHITWRSIGGSIDLYFFSGPSQPEVTRSYLEVVGMPALQQYWTLGFHQCRWGYTSWQELDEVVNNYTHFNIPMETIWTDIDYLERYRDFENTQGFNYKTGKEFLDRLHQSGRHYVPIIDSAIYIPNPSNPDDAYPTFERGNDTDSFLKNPDGSLYIGAVWPGYTVFPDWLSNGAEGWWTDEMVEYYKNVAYDGAWIDMSEVSSFCTGSCGSGKLMHNPVHPPFSLPGEPQNLVLDYPEGFNVTNKTEAASASAAVASSTSAYPASTATSSTSYVSTKPTPGARNVNYPPYTINSLQGALAAKAVSPNATHADGTLEYDVHNLWGTGILHATNKALSKVFPNARPFIIGRSTFAGSGAVAGHWGGDNYSKWAYMYFSIPQALQMSLFGIPMFGVDTCGFAGNSDMELCSRWMQLSAFFPFYRNHNTLSAIPQEAYRWGAVIKASQVAMDIRYRLLPYMYTLMYNAHKRGDTVMRALAWEFPDPSLANADRQFMLGPSLLVTPVLEQGMDSVDGIFPGLVQGTEIWYDWFNGTAVPKPSQANTTIDAPLGHIPVHVRGGSVLPLQQPALTTNETRSSPWDILVALSRDGEAGGELYLDDGVSVEPSSTLTVTFTAQDRKLNARITQGGWEDTNQLQNVTLWGVSDVNVQNVRFNGKAVGPQKVRYDEERSTLIVTGFDTQAWRGEGWSLEW
ncbi:hypothetical protein N7492_009875 [Penicillium capsulatum]|uniref:alpha-glucosidase n=1 Tax=Penicillium capsulatum TaxID=69766 RepID=A0A9W9LEW8_9EURO|nr:hypothetical protein N7492_009875 [Penicillium capsulatum]KAJ6112386.1 hypothetical protein N7512_007710 [Penicillium capsulatum]